MISKDNYQLVKKAIKIHNNLKDRTYLILYKVNSKQKAKIMETPILEENFWHLVGCKIDDSKKLTPEQKRQVYLKCLAEEDVSDLLVYTRQSQDVGARIQIVQVKMRIPYYKFYGTM